MSTFWPSHYARRAQRLRAFEIRELLHVVEEPDVISFAGGFPAPELFPIDECRAACERLLAAHGERALQYGTTEGYLPLREMIARHLSRLGIEVGPANILITSGSQQALDLIGRLFLSDGDVVVVEEPTSLGAIQAWHTFGPRFVAVPVDEDGVRIDRLEEVLRKGPVKLVYVMPNFQNPAGVTLSELRRLRIIELTDRYQVPIVENDPYGQLRFEGDHLTPLHVLDADRMSGGPQGTPARDAHVLYVSTLSRLLAPGLRIGWVVGPESVISRLVLAKQSADLHTGTLAQLLAYEMCHGGFLDRHVRKLNHVYRERRDAMLRALEEHMPAGVRWTRPDGGFFVWLALPAELDARELLQRARELQVAFVPGAGFHAAGGGRNTARLNFSYSDPDRIRTGVRRLGRVVEEALAASGPRVL